MEIEQRVSETVNTLLRGKSHIKLLEAGCGSATHIRFNPEIYAVGIDISKEQLEKNTSLREKLQGDIQEYPLPENEFDVAICWMVLEHLPRPKDALRNLNRALKPGGLLILGFPNLISIKGIVTKFTPFWFHEQYYKFMKYTSDHFPTYLRTDILPKNVTRFAEENGMSVEMCRIEEGRVPRRLRARFRVADWLFRAVDKLVWALTFGRVSTILLDVCAVVLRKRAVHG